MSSRCRDELMGVLVVLWATCLLTACDQRSRQAGPAEQPDREGVVDSALAPGLGHPKAPHACGVKLASNNAICAGGLVAVPGSQLRGCYGT